MYWDGAGWAWWMVLMTLVWIVLIGLVIWAAVRLTKGHGDGAGRRDVRDHRESPEEILDRRFASGEIDADAHAEARKHLAAHRPNPR